MAFSDYERLGPIGSGGAATVFRARGRDGQIVAIKLLRRRGPLDMARFERERRLLGSFGEAEGFVPLLDSGEGEEGPFLVMPLLEGGTLRTQLDRGPQPLETVVQLGRTLALAVGWAHERGVVHRDLKPENVLFGRNGRPLVADLGLAKHFDRDMPGGSESVTVSQRGQFRGTPAYMAPEQMDDASQVDARADVYSIGVILYEALVGKPPFRGETLSELVARVSGGAYVRIRDARQDTPLWLGLAIERALSRNPAERYRTGFELAHALGARLPQFERGPSTVLDASLGDAPARLGRRVAWLGALGVAGLLGAVGLALSFRKRGDEPRPPVLAEPSIRLEVPAEWQEGPVEVAAVASEGVASVRLSLLADGKSAPGVPLVEKGLEVRTRFMIPKGVTVLLASVEGTFSGRKLRIERAISVAPRGWFEELMPRGLRRGAEQPIYLWENGKGLEVELVYVPPGDFRMGAVEGGRSEKPLHTHPMPRGYYIGRFEATWRQFRIFCRATGRREPTAPKWGAMDSHPVVNVSFEDCVAFCDWAGLRLPSEAEWEKAARGDDGRKWPWGNEWVPGVANVVDRSCPEQNVNGREAFDDGAPYTAPAGRFRNDVSVYGAQDMGGNVAERCRDWMDEGVYEAYARGHFEEPLGGARHVVRGGSWSTSRWVACVTTRWPSGDEGFDQAGFRPLLESPHGP